MQSIGLTEKLALEVARPSGYFFFNEEELPI
jgi:hypothetical protein